MALGGEIKTLILCTITTHLSRTQTPTLDKRFLAQTCAVGGELLWVFVTLQNTSSTTALTDVKKSFNALKTLSHGLEQHHWKLQFSQLIVPLRYLDGI